MEGELKNSFKQLFVTWLVQTYDEVDMMFCVCVCVSYHLDSVFLFISSTRAFLDYFLIDGFAASNFLRVLILCTTQDQLVEFSRG